ncbi:uncharacterized protein LOC126808645, partial [Patella vulgata]|uniref:uncharacterized protein LOC126808645 n=1 Tax=Patella vulgata TaxID=6465 RepID=UPI0021806527
YNVGEDIKIKLQLYNGYGDKVKRGGDDIRIRIYERIIMEEFSEFRERVVYLNIWDMNMSLINP